MSEPGGRAGHATPGPDPADPRALLAAAQAAVQEWARRTMPAPPSGHPGPECTWCPLCQLASALRGEHPDLSEALAAALADVGAAVGEALGVLARSAVAASGRAGGTGRPRPRPTPGGAGRVEHIVIAEAGSDTEPREH